MREWIKVRRGWYEGLSHGYLSGDALHLGPFLLYLASPSWDPDVSEEASILHPHGGPLTDAQIANKARWPVSKVRKAIAELVAAGTMARREDGALTFPHYGRHQETPDARRKRLARKQGKSGAGKAESPADIPGDFRGPTEAEVEAEADVELEQEESDSADSARRVWDAYNAARATLPGTRSLKFSKLVARNLRARIKEHGEQAAREVLMRYVEEARRSGSAEWCNATTPLRAENFERTLGRIGQPIAHTSGHYKHTGTEEYAGGDVEL